MDYRIPYAPPDITSGAKLLLGVLQNNREQDRADYNTQINATNANNAFVKESAQAARESDLAAERKADRERQKGIEAAGAFGKIKDLVRRSKEDPGAISEAMVLGKAYGIDVREAAKKAGEEDAAKQQQQAPAPLPTLLQAALPVQPEAPPAAPVSAEPGNELQAMGQAQGQYTGAPLEEGTEGPLEAGDERMHPAAEMAEQGPGPANVIKIDEPIGINADIPTPPMPPTPEAAPSAVTAPPQMAAATVPQRQNPLFEAVMGGQTYQLGGSNEGEATGLGPRYDELAKAVRAMGGGDKDVKAAVLAQHLKDMSAEDSMQRTKALIGARETAATTKETNREKELATYQQTASEKTRLREEAIRAITAKAAADQGTKAETSADRTINTYMQIAKEAKAAAGAKSDVTGMRPINRIIEELQNPDPIVQKTAVDSMATIAAGGKAPLAVLHELANPFDQFTSVKNKIYQQFHGGMNLPEVNDAFAKAAAKLAKVSKAQRVNDFNAWEHAAGRSSQWYNPAMAPLVDDQRAATLDELGLNEADVKPVQQQSSDMGINPGMGAATRPKGPSGKGGHLTPKAPKGNPEPIPGQKTRDGRQVYRDADGNLFAGSQ